MNTTNVPVRRTTRVTRTTVQKDKENATRSSRLRAKPPSSTVAPSDPPAKPTGIARAAGATTRSRAAAAPASKTDPAAQGKRKREALGEVPRPPANILAKQSDLKGKEKGKERFDGVVLHKTATTTTTTTTTTLRQPLKHVGGAIRPSTTAAAPARKTRSAVTAKEPPARLTHVQEEQESAEEQDDNAMAISPEKPAPVDPAPVPAPRRFSAARELAAAGHPMTATTARIPVPKRAPRHTPREVDEDEAYRPYKKQRTSSVEPPEEAERAQWEDENAAQVIEEVGPDNDQWQDLDAQDGDDPLMVSEYVVEIFNYLKNLEYDGFGLTVMQQSTMPNPNYMEMQKDLAWKMRGILTDWLIQVHSRFRLLPETFFLCVNIIDRFLSQRVVSLAKLQLVGITCMFIAAKVEEIVAPSASNFLMVADSSYTENEILQAERYVLKTLNWNMSYPNPMQFLRRVSKADDYNVQVRTIAKFLMEIQCVEWRLIAAPPSLIAAASIWLARLVLGFTEWTPTLAHYSSYAESELVPTANLMLNYILKPVKHHSFFRKYAGKKYLKASEFVRAWALERWQENQPVSLLEELPTLKADIRAANARNDHVLGSEF
ncbi:hypothetical protein K474DRAFT_1679342 [Panus rudis PR-1116 ss-1]|nr:hypothetical protein K474DRAFT_1679342 [Panus rudis PR-1116 ss-1]